MDMFPRGLTIAATLLLAACASSVRTPTEGARRGVPPNYPPAILDSTEHRDAMRAEWERLFAEYAIPPERRQLPDLEPFTHTPRSILGVGPIRLATGAGAEPIDEERVRLLLREFVDDHPQLVGATSAGLSLETVASAGPIGTRYAYAQSTFAHAIAPPFGRVEFVVSPRAEILQMSSTAIPLVDLPAEPRVERETAEETVLGSTFTYSDVRGQEQTVTVTDRSQVKATRLVIFPETAETAMRVRLAWEVEAGSGMTWTVFVDAITGEKVGTRQNFQT